MINLCSGAGAATVKDIYVLKYHEHSSAPKRLRESRSIVRARGNALLTIGVAGN